IDKPVMDARTTSTARVLLALPDVHLKVALPGAIPVTTPAVSTAAIAGLSEAQAIATSLRGVPVKVRAVALSFVAPPTTTGELNGSRSIVVTAAGLTTTLAKPGFPATIAPI